MMVLCPIYLYIKACSVALMIYIFGNVQGENCYRSTLDFPTTYTGKYEMKYKLEYRKLRVYCYYGYKCCSTGCCYDNDAYYKRYDYDDSYYSSYSSSDSSSTWSLEEVLGVVFAVVVALGVCITCCATRKSSEESSNNTQTTHAAPIVAFSNSQNGTTIIRSGTRSVPDELRERERQHEYVTYPESVRYSSSRGDQDRLREHVTYPESRYSSSSREERLHERDTNPGSRESQNSTTNSEQESTSHNDPPPYVPTAPPPSYEDIMANQYQLFSSESEIRRSRDTFSDDT